MSDATVYTALSKARYLAPNLAYSLALQDSLKQLQILKDTGREAEYNAMIEVIITALLTVPAVGDA